MKNILNIKFNNFITHIKISQPIIPEYCGLKSNICGAMKNINLSYYAWAVFFPNSFSAHDIEPQQGFNIAQQYDNSARYLSSGENIFWEVYF